MPTEMELLREALAESSTDEERIDLVQRIGYLANEQMKSEELDKLDEIRRAERDLATAIRQIVRGSQYVAMGNKVERILWSEEDKPDGGTKVQMILNPKHRIANGQGGTSQKIWRREVEGQDETLTSRELVDRYANDAQRMSSTFLSWPASLVPKINTHLHPPFYQVED